MSKQKLGGDDDDEEKDDETGAGLDTVGCTANLVMVDYER